MVFTPSYVPEFSLRIGSDVYEVELISFKVLDAKTLKKYQLFYNSGLGFFIKKNGNRMEADEIPEPLRNTMLNLNFTIPVQQTGLCVYPLTIA